MNTLQSLSIRAVAALAIVTGVALSGSTAAVAAPKPTAPAPAESKETGKPSSKPDETAVVEDQPTQDEVGPAAAISPDQIKPFLVCTWIGKSQFVSVFGYSSGASGNLPIGVNNNFSPIAANQGQPTSFVAGVDNNAVVVTHTGAITWHLGAGDANAPVDDKPCKTNPMPMTGNPLAIVAWIVAGIVVVGAITLAKRRRARNAWA